MRELFDRSMESARGYHVGALPLPREPLFLKSVSSVKSVVQLRSRSPLRFDKQRGKCSVEMVVNGNRRSGFGEVKLRDLSIDGINDSFVFFWLDAAGAVNEATA